MKRLLEELEPGFERTLVGAGAAEKPSALGRRRALKSALVALGGSALALPARASAGAGTSLLPPTATAAAKTGLGIAGLKWVVFGVIAGGAVAMPAFHALRTTAHPSQEHALVESQNPRSRPLSAPSPSITPIVAPLPAPVTAAPFEEAPSVPDAPTRRRREMPAQLADEVRSLDLVRAALAAHDSPRALELLVRHQKRFLTPALGPEASLLRIQALVNLGDREAASGVAARLLATHGDASYRERVRRLLGDATPGQ